MRSIRIDLAQPFEEVLATVLSLPTDCSSQDGHRLGSDVGFKQVIRGLYEAANGRQVETKWGRVALAPPTAAFLKTKPFHVATQVDSLVAAVTRIISGPPRLAVGMRAAGITDETPVLRPVPRERTLMAGRRTAGPDASRHQFKPPHTMDVTFQGEHGLSAHLEIKSKHMLTN